MRERYDAINKKMSKWEDFFNSPDYQDFKKEVLDVRLNSLKDNIVISEPGSEEQKRLTYQYQELLYVSENFFKVAKQASDAARKKLREIDNIDKTSRKIKDIPKDVRKYK